jgi:hypothetical protein
MARSRRAVVAAILWVGKSRDVSKVLLQPVHTHTTILASVVWTKPTAQFAENGQAKKPRTVAKCIIHVKQ